MEVKMQLNYEQKRLINSTLMGNSIIKGVAGSGKTTVAVNRIPFLIQNYCMEEDKILMVTFNKSLIDYIDYIYSEIEEDIQIQTFAKKEKLDIINIDKIIFNYFCQSSREKHIKLKIALEPEINAVYHKCISELSQIYKEIKLLDSKYLGFLKKEIGWIKACGINKLEQYQVVDRLGRMSSKSAKGSQKLQKNSKTRQAIFELMELYNRRMRQENLVDFEDVGWIALDYVKAHTIQKYTHIIIDESQDLSKTQLECLLCLYDNSKSYSSILFVSDTAQSIYPTAWLVKGRSFTSIGLDMTGRSNSLAKNYRTTTQIAEAAYSLIKDDTEIVEDDNFVKPFLIDKQGYYPVLRGFPTLCEELAYVKSLILEKLLKQYSKKDIAVVARTKRILEDAEQHFGSEISNSIYSNSKKIDFKKEEVKLLTMHSIKGLEFKVVILIGLSEGILPNQVAILETEDREYIETLERKLLYVGMTRATEQLYLSYHKVPSNYLKQIDGKLLRLRDCSKIRTYYTIPIEEYYFLEKLADPYKKEEQVRQWLLKELIETYQYPASLLDIEYLVQLFSKSGYVDIVVCIQDKKEKIPFILAEVKQYGSGIKSAKEQMRSYHAVVQKCRYCIITDGNELMIFNKEFEEINDIPVFDISMLPSMLEHYLFCDFIKGNKRAFSVDGSTREIMIEDLNEPIILTKESLMRIPIYTEIAAGEPITLVDEITDMCYLPLEWISDKSNLFFLKIKGDSMVNAEINNGDFVLIRKQNVIENGQIAAVEIDGKTTLKRIRKSGSMLVLLPENDNYEPEIIAADQIRIIGVGVGVLKKIENKYHFDECIK